MPVTTARQRVLAYLTKNRAVSAAQIGRALKMTAANVRHHLSVLCSDGRVSVVDQARKAGRGRPVKLYGLSESLMGNNLALLSDGMLDEFFNKLSLAKKEDAIKTLAKHLATINKVAESNNISKRLSQTIESLNGLNYQSKWEAGAEGPHILLGHCPYAAIIGKHPELCRMDAALLMNFMGESARQISKIGRGGSQLCAFVLGKT